MCKKEKKTYQVSPSVPNYGKILYPVYPRVQAFWITDLYTVVSVSNIYSEKTFTFKQKKALMPKS